MLNFVLNQPNTFVVTLFQERKTAGNDYFIVFVHEQERKAFTDTITDVSPQRHRYSQFTVDLPFVHEGDYEYKIYEDSTRENLIEVGKMRLTAAPVVPAVNDVQTNNNIINEIE
jgi:hypothetical protein